jgi:hypothetical protein
MPSAGPAQNSSQPTTTNGLGTAVNTPASQNADGPLVPVCIAINDDGTTTYVGGCSAPGTVFTIDCPT